MSKASPAPRGERVESARAHVSIVESLRSKRVDSRLNNNKKPLAPLKTVLSSISFFTSLYSYSLRIMSYKQRCTTLSASLAFAATSLIPLSASALIADGNSPLKSQFPAEAQNDLADCTTRTSYKEMRLCVQRVAQNYNIQLSPRRTLFGRPRVRVYHSNLPDQAKADLQQCYTINHALQRRACAEEVRDAYGLAKQQKRVRLYLNSQGRYLSGGMTGFSRQYAPKISPAAKEDLKHCRFAGSHEAKMACIRAVADEHADIVSPRRSFSGRFQNRYYFR